MGSPGRTIEGARPGASAEGWRGPTRGAGARLLGLITPLARPLTAGLFALVVYLIRAGLARTGFEQTDYAYFNYLADAFLHGQLHLRLPPRNEGDLVFYADRLYLYWPPFPAVVLLPLVALFGVGVTDIAYTAVFGALCVALTAWLLAALDESGVAPLAAERRALLVLTVAFGSVVLILAPVGTVWFTAQLIGFGCVLLATIAALRGRGPWGYFLVGLALACALTTRMSLLFNGVWLAYYLLRRDWGLLAGARAWRAAWGLAPVLAGIGALAWYNWARFGSPAETGLDWHAVNPFFREEFERYGVFNLHYLGTNLRHQFWSYPVLAPLEEQKWLGGGLFWMTPLLLGAPWALWRRWREPLIWTLVLSCLLVYIPIGLLMGTGWVTFGPRYLLDLMVPLLVLTAIGIRRWPLALIAALAAISCLTYGIGSRLWLLAF